jgi:hypothetical protein
MLNSTSIVLSPSRPSNLASAAAAVLHGACPLTVSDIPSDHPTLAIAVRELAEATGMPVPAPYDTQRVLIPARDYFAPGTAPSEILATASEPVDTDPDPREAFPYSAHEADDHYEWALLVGLATPDTDTDSDPSRWIGVILF